MARILKPPAPLLIDDGVPSVFLAGSIEMGQAEDWQAFVERSLKDLDVVILNPRRDEWDATWAQTIHNPQFKGQVEWELEGQERATLIAMYFAPATRAPVTLLEFGLMARSGKLIACCPEGYWRKGNVEVVCARYQIPLVGSLQELVVLVRERLSRLTSTKVQALSDKAKLQRSYVPVTALAKVVKFDDEMLRVTFTDGRVLSVPLAWFPVLRKATPEQRARYEIGGGGISLHWPKLDEDLSVAGLMAGVDWRSA